MSGLTGLLRAAALKNGAGTATVYTNRRRTWNEVLDRVSRVAGGLRELGVRDNTFVAVLALNSDRYLELHFAVPWAGGVLEPLNIRWSPQENAFAVRAARARVLVVDDEFLSQGLDLLNECDSLEALVHIGEDPAPDLAVSYEGVLVAAVPVPDAGRGGDDACVVFYTSGTTAQSKGVELTHRNALFVALAFHATIPLDTDCVHLHLLGLFHVGGARPRWYVTMAAGTHVIHKGFDPAELLVSIPTHRVTNTVMVPTMISLLIHHQGLQQTDLSTMRTCVYGGSPMPRSLLEEAMRLLPTWEFHQIYGQTELGGYGSALTWSDHRTAIEGCQHRLRSAGTAIPGTEIRIVDSSGDAVSPGSVGEILLRGDNVMRRYFDSPNETSRVLDSGWLRTGDAGYLQDGYLYIADRVKDMIITGGENVYSVDVEAVLHLHPAVRECAVIGIPHPVWVETVHAVVVLEDRSAVTEQQILDHCRARIGGYKCPKSVEFHPGPLPTTPVGKIRKNVLRDPWWDRQERCI